MTTPPTIRSARRCPTPSEDLVVSYTRLLDAFVYAKFDLGDDGRGAAPRPPGGELGREHLHPERHQRHQPFRRVGAARAGLGAQGRLPAAGDGQLQPAVQRQLVRAGYLHHRLERDGARAGRFVFQHQRLRAHRRQQGGARLRFVLRPGRGLPAAGRAVHHQLPDGEPAATPSKPVGRRPVRLQPQVLRARLQQRHGVRPVLPELPQPSAADLRPDRHPGGRRQCLRRVERGRRARRRRWRRACRVPAAIATAAQPGRARARPPRAAISRWRRPRSTPPSAPTRSSRAATSPTQASNIATHEYALTVRLLHRVSGRHQADRPVVQHAAAVGWHRAAG